MNALSKIRNAGFEVTLDGNGVIIAPLSKLLPNQLEFLKSHKAKIISELRQEATLSDDGYFYGELDDRRHCHECQSLIKGRCVIQRFRPLDDMPRRCADFIGGRL